MVRLIHSPNPGCATALSSARFGNLLRWVRRRGLLWGLVLVALAVPSRAIPLSELDNTPKLTPKKFASYFETFRYRLHREVQPANRFLLSRSGDCDDYAVLADHVLPSRGYETRLVHVRLAGMVDHAVCYVTEQKAYLDYNNRAVFFNLTRAKPSLRAIAEKVANSLNANWTSASKFLYTHESDRKTITTTVVRTADPAKDPSPRKAPAPDQVSLGRLTPPPSNYG
ncbi:MAG: hypothetical protein J6386_01230 [Candidatus Synoicihabitans palmerolidicus]|nr:hypothetical protein [Candidatus Synoicihabitans palmerolidicus]